MSIMFLRMSEMGKFFHCSVGSPSASSIFLSFQFSTYVILIFSLTFIDCDCPYFLLCRWVLLEVLDKVSPGSVNWKLATKPPIKMPFRKVENCNQVIQIGKDLNFSLVNVAGNDFVQGNKKLLVGECHVIPFL